MQSVSIIGVGRVGGALALALPKNEYEIVNLVARSNINAMDVSIEIGSKPIVLPADQLKDLRENIIFITTQDFEIKNIVQRLAEIKPAKGTFVFHTSGSLSSNVLKELSNTGYRVGSIHPLVSISDSKLGAKRFRNAYFCVEGEDPAVRVARKIVDSLGGISFSIETQNKELYHASAVTACGHLVALLDTAFRMFSKCGMDESQSKEILMPLIKSTVCNLEEQTSSEALTGTFDRVDIETFERHLEVMKTKLSDEDIGVYLKLGRQSLGLVEKDFLNSTRIQEMKKRLLREEKMLQDNAL